jgi:threonylcarbamoyladenosine tRNA methylthiotransferase MtaB
VAITTDIITGFPGETDAEFEESYRFCKEAGFARIHVFPYSPRAETRAAQMPLKIEAGVKKGRTAKMLTLARESMLNFNRSFLGRTVPVLWEKRSASGVWSGHAPNYIKVYTRSDDDLTNEIVPAKLEEIGDDGVFGEVSDE